VNWPSQNDADLGSRVLTARTFLITGASKGIGRAIAEKLSADGHQVVGIARDVTSFPGELVSLDLADREATAETLAGLVGRYRFDGIINNVGIVRPGALGKLSLDDLDSVLSLNVHSAVSCTQAVLPSMKSQRWGRVINISSLSALGVMERSAYAAAKSALISLARTWALELARYGIAVNAIAPGPIETEMFRKTNPVGSPAESSYLRRVPMKRFGQPDEVAALVSYLLSDAAGFITGQTVFIDGGASIGSH